MQASSSKSSARPFTDRRNPFAPQTTGSGRPNPSRILRDLTDLFVSRTSPTGMEILRYEEIAVHLANDADGPGLTYVAAKLAGHPAAPVVLLDTLLRLNQSCAKILAEHCPRLSPAPLIAFAEGDDESLAAAVARRPGLTPQLSDVLSRRPESGVLCALAANPAAEMSAATLERLVLRARDDARLARLLLQRTDDFELFIPLFLHADRPIRAAMIARAEQHTFSMDEIIRLKPLGRALHDWIMRRNPLEHADTLAREFARQCGLGKAQVLPMMADREGEGLALILAAIGLSGDDAVRLFLRCESPISHSLERIRALKQIVENVPAHAALRLLDAIAAPVHGDKATQAKGYQPMHDVGARPLAGRANPVSLQPLAKAHGAIRKLA